MRQRGVTDSEQIRRFEHLREELALTWHHLDDLDADMKSTFEFVHLEVHRSTVTHLGSNGQAEYIYKSLKNN